MAFEAASARPRVVREHPPSHRPLARPTLRPGGLFMIDPLGAARPHLRLAPDFTVLGFPETAVWLGSGTYADVLGLKWAGGEGSLKVARTNAVRAPHGTADLPSIYKGVYNIAESTDQSLWVETMVLTALQAATPAPYLPHVLATVATPTILAYFMTYYDGPSVSRMWDAERGLARGVLAEAGLRQVLFDVLVGTALVTMGGWIHCDIHPGNVLLRSEPDPHCEGAVLIRATLVDFGAARPCWRMLTRDTLTASWVRPPELMNVFGDILPTPAADAWSVALTLWTAATGEWLGAPVGAPEGDAAIERAILERYVSVLGLPSDADISALQAAGCHARSIWQWRRAFTLDASPRPVEVVALKLEALARTYRTVPVVLPRAFFRCIAAALRWDPTARATPMSMLRNPFFDGVYRDPMLPTLWAAVAAPPVTLHELAWGAALESAVRGLAVMRARMDAMWSPRVDPASRELSLHTHTGILTSATVALAELAVRLWTHEWSRIERRAWTPIRVLIRYANALEVLGALVCEHASAIVALAREHPSVGSDPGPAACAVYTLVVTAWATVHRVLAGPRESVNTLLKNAIAALPGERLRDTFRALHAASAGMRPSGAPVSARAGLKEAVINELVGETITGLTAHAHIATVPDFVCLAYGLRDDAADSSPIPITATLALYYAWLVSVSAVQWVLPPATLAHAVVYAALETVDPGTFAPEAHMEVLPVFFTTPTGVLVEFPAGEHFRPVTLVEYDEVKSVMAAFLADPLLPNTLFSRAERRGRAERVPEALPALNHLHLSVEGGVGGDMA